MADEAAKAAAVEEADVAATELAAHDAAERWLGRRLEELAEATAPADDDAAGTEQVQGGTRTWRRLCTRDPRAPLSAAAGRHASG